MGKLTVELNDYQSWTIEPPLADEIGKQVLAIKRKPPSALVFARDVLAAGGSELRDDPKFRELVEYLEEPEDDARIVGLSWQQ